LPRHPIDHRSIPELRRAAADIRFPKRPRSRAPRATREQAGSRPARKRYKLIAGEIGAATDRLGRKHDTTGEEHTMKLLYFDDFKLGVLKNDAVVDVSAAVKDIPHIGPGDLMNGLIEHWGSYQPRLEAAAARGAEVPVSSVRIRPPVPGPRTIDCMAVNYMEDGTRNTPAPINAFHKSPSAIIGHGDTMVLPDVPATVFEGEAEIAVVIGKKCSHVSEAEAMSYIFGYMNFIDGSARGLPPPGNVFFQMKSRDTFAPIGPYLVTADEIKDPLKLQIRLWNNGVLMQNFNTDDMGHKIGKCIAWLSTIHTLLPGDIVATGTNHRGLNPFMDGDTIELETEGLGRLKFGVKDDLKRSWARKTRLQMHEEAREKTPGAYPDITPQLSGKYAK
jgi:2-keto-4-pentenoate hydratase/2-oxohepta-3-ene-1,7-dioic acid hydratase in catechol pathway